MAKTGRPSKITQEVTPGSTHADVLIEKITMGLHQRAACDLAGINKSTLHRWTLEGSRLTALATQDKLPKPTKEQLALVDFSDRLSKAYAEAEANRLAIIDRIAQGGVKTERTVVKYATKIVDGEPTRVEVERVVHTDTLRPEWTAAAWYLERTHPDKYGKRIELTGAEGSALVPPAQQAKALGESLAEFQAGVEAGRQVEHAKANGES